MTIASQTSRISYTGNGSTTAFSVPFYFAANADLIVYLKDTSGTQTLQVLGTNYNLTGATVSTGGTCTFTIAPASGYVVTVYRDPPATQTTSYNNNDPFPAKSHEAALDKLTTLIQRVKDKISRSVTLVESSIYTGLTLPDPQAGRYLKWKQDVSGLENSADITFAPNSYAIATQSEAEAGALNTVLMTPLRTNQAINIAFGSPLSSIVGISPMGIRLTLTSGTPITTTDVAAATQIFCTPFVSGWVRIWNGTADTLSEVSEITLNLDSTAGHAGYHQSGKNFDVFVTVSSAIVVAGTGPAWSTDFVRGAGAGTTEVEFYKGLWRNKNSITLRTGSNVGDTIVVPARQATLVGGFRATANGQASDTVLRRFLSNAYNPAPRFMYANGETLGTTWNYTLLTWRQVNANTSNMVEIFQCLPGGPIECTAVSTAANSGGVATKYVGIGVNSVLVNSGKDGLLPTVGANLVGQGSANYSAYASLGYTYLAWLEISATSGTTSWYAGDSAAAAVFSNGIRAKVWN